MATPFKLKSGNPSSFKNLGSSPVKVDISKNFNKKGSSAVGKLAKSAVDAVRASKVKTQNFRNEANKIKTVSSKTNKGTKVVNASKVSTKKSKAIQLLKKGQKVAKKIITHPVTKKAVSISKKVAGLLPKALRVGGKFGGAVFNIMPAPMINPLGEKYDEKGKL